MSVDPAYHASMSFYTAKNPRGVSFLLFLFFFLHVSIDIYVVSKKQLILVLNEMLVQGQFSGTRPLLA